VVVLVPAAEDRLDLENYRESGWGENPGRRNPSRPQRLRCPTPSRNIEGDAMD
jgi:hypothetical protein